MKPEKRRAYWRKNLQYLGGLLTVWFVVSYGCGILSKRMNREGAVAGMIVGLLFTSAYIVWFKFLHPEMNDSEHWFLGLSPEGIGTLGMVLNFAVALVVSRVTPPPPKEIEDLVEDIRIPEGA